MPASTKALATAILLALIVTLPSTSTFGLYKPREKVGVVSSLSQSANAASISSALRWLVSNQSSDGSYGAYSEQQTAAAALALWLNNSNSAPAKRAFSYLSGQLDNASTWFWPPYGEADFPGAVLSVLSSTNQLGLLHNATGVYARLLEFQADNGGFLGYYDSSLGTVTSSVDTAESLRGLSSAGEIALANETAAVNYLLSLQNTDGSFNLTSTVRANPLDSLGPDPVSTTALVVLALREAFFTLDDSSVIRAVATSVSRALDFLGEAIAGGLGGQRHTYAAALSALAFISSYRLSDASRAVIYLQAQQNPDNGFSDAGRSSAESNALDTGWAATALQLSVQTQPAKVERSPVARFSISAQNVAEDASISFSAAGSNDPDGDTISYAWAFGDGAFATGVNVVHSYARSGNFTVTLVVREVGTPQALSDTTWQTVTVQSPSQPANTSTAPQSSIPLILVLIVGTIGVVVVVTTYLVLRSRKE